MNDREKVIKGLTAHMNGNCNKSDCPWFECEEDGCIKSMFDAALKLLKEQEPKNGEWITIWREDNTSTHAKCSVCNRASERPLGGFCKWCGAKMSQEWGVDG